MEESVSKVFPCLHDKETFAEGHNKEVSKWRQPWLLAIFFISPIDL